MKWTTTFLAIVALTMTHPGSAFAQPTGPEALQPLVGDYVIVGRNKAIERRDASIEKVVDELNFFIRSIARNRLRDGNPVPKSLSIEQSGSKMTIRFDGEEWTAVVGGNPVKGTGSSGDPVKMTLRQRGTQLSQRFDGEEGGKENVFRRTKDGVVVKARVFSDRLPSDVVYQLQFRRK